MSNKENFIYFPSFSAGVLGGNAKKDTYFINEKIPARFWADDYLVKPYKYFLLTAGHDYKKMECRNTYGLQDSLVFGDSGGYQIASGAIKWEPGIEKQIFEWLEYNSDVAMNLDIPPRMKYEGKFKECLEISKSNFKYFRDNQTGKTDFLNVLQGSDYDTFKKWYDEVKEFEFQGWGIGGIAGSIFKFLSSMCVLLQGKEHLKSTNKWIHILGTSKIFDFIIISQFQKSLNDIGCNIRITTDSSSPNRSTRFGNLYSGYNIHKTNFETLHLKRAMFEENDPIIQIPDNSIFDKKVRAMGYTLNDVCKFDTDGYLFMVHHNLQIFLNAINDVNYYVQGHNYLKEQIFKSDVNKIIDIVDEMVKNDNPYNILSLNMPIIKEISTRFDDKHITNDITKTNFFK